MKRDLKYSNRKNLIKDKCIICDTVENLENHRIEAYTKENVLCLCKKHHSKIHQLMTYHPFYKLLKEHPELYIDDLICQLREDYEAENK